MIENEETPGEANSFVPPRPWPLLIAPLFAAAAVGLVYGSLGIEAFAIGAVGWLVALLPRKIILVAVQSTQGQQFNTGNLMLAISGPAEELTRLAALLIVGTKLPAALWLGVGWALAEAATSVFSITSVRKILRENGKRAEALRAEIGTGFTQRRGERVAAAAERGGATMAHLGFAIWIATNPWAVVPAMVVHSLFNAMAIYFATRASLLWTEAAIVTVGAAILVTGFYYWH